jgi:hypothetical protein
MSASIACSSAAASSAAFPPAAASRRDLRLDYMRGIALLLIFIDHVSGNRFAALTLQSMGFADGAEIFVLIAGMSSIYAFRKRFLAEGVRAGAAAVARRIRTLYLAHLGMAAGLLAVVALAMSLGTGFDIVGKIGVAPLLEDPARALLAMATLGYLPHYMDILPLYILLLATLPLVIVGLRRHPLLPLAIASGMYGVAQALALNLPNLGMERGWFLNPFTWGLLFVAGATAAELAIRGSFARLPRPLMLAVTLVAAAYVVFGFLYAAPWRFFPALETFIAVEIALAADKTFLSWHRLADIAAKAWLVAVLIPPTAGFMARGLGGAISRAGRNSLPLFIAGTFLSVLGSIALYEAGGHALAHIGVTAGGVFALLGMAWLLERSAAQPRNTVQPAPVPIFAR